jgi:thioester reductase-like protein
MDSSLTTLNQILDQIHRQGITLRAEGDRLRICAPKGVLTPELQNLLRDHKTDLLAWLNQNNENMLDQGMNLQTEAILDNNIYPETQYSQDKMGSFKNRSASVFLTGSTGFLGAFLLFELLKQTQANIYCLVRAVDLRSAQTRIQQNLELYHLWDERFMPRISPILGDISKPLLGLTVEQFHTLASQIDVIYHSAATLNYLYSYLQLKSINVLGTQEVLKLACHAQAKPLHYISSVVVFEGSVYAQKTITELDNPDSSEGIYLGYSQSKWVAEQLMTIARSRGLAVNIYRLPFIGGHSQTGIGNTNDLACRLIKGYIQMGSIPDLEDWIDLSPVDYASQAIVYLSQQKNLLNHSFHLNNPHPCPREKMLDIIRAYGYPLKKLPYEKWQEQLQILSNSCPNSLSPLLTFFSKRWSQNQLTIPELYQRIWKPQFDCQATLKALMQGSISSPPTVEKLLHIYLPYFVHSGFIKAPFNSYNQPELSC